MRACSTHSSPIGPSAVWLPARAHKFDRDRSILRRCSFGSLPMALSAHPADLSIMIVAAVLPRRLAALPADLAVERQSAPLAQCRPTLSANLAVVVDTVLLARGQATSPGSLGARAGSWPPWHTRWHWLFSLCCFHHTICPHVTVPFFAHLNDPPQGPMSLRKRIGRLCATLTPRTEISLRLS
jgi:hypothetical protein